MFTLQSSMSSIENVNNNVIALQKVHLKPRTNTWSLNLLGAGRWPWNYIIHSMRAERAENRVERSGA